jgi:hypothetical protein
MAIKATAMLETNERIICSHSISATVPLRPETPEILTLLQEVGLLLIFAFGSFAGRRGWVIAVDVVGIVLPCRDIVPAACPVAGSHAAYHIAAGIEAGLQDIK